MKASRQGQCLTIKLNQKMKKNIFISAALAIVAFTACQQEKLNGDDTTVDGFRVYAEETKASLDGCKVVFEEGDKIDIYADDAEAPAIYSYDQSTDMFVPTGTVANGNKYSAIYPSQENNSRTIINIPRRQKPVVVNGHRQTCLYMAGVSTTKEISLKHLVGLWEIDLLPLYDGQKITNAKLTFTKKHRVNGNFAINWEDYSLNYVDGGDGYEIWANEINYTMTEGESLKIYFALPPGQYDGGFEFVAIMDDGTRMVKQSPATINIVRGQITKVKNDVNYSLFASGSGTNQDPYVLNTADHWNNMVAKVNKGEKQYQEAYYQLGAGIDFAGKSVTPMSTFKGVLDGNGKTLKNAEIGDGKTSHQAFFYLLNGTVKNLKFENITVNAGGKTDTESSAAVIAAGNSSSKFTIENCHVTNSNVTSAGEGSNAAGIVARCNHSGVIISGCSVSYTTITAGKEHVGGVVGYLGKGTVDCVESSANTIAGGSYVGGVIGTLADGTLVNVISTDNTSSVSSASCGGVVGVCTSDNAKIINVYSKGNTVECGNTNTTTPCLGLIIGCKKASLKYLLANTLTLSGTAKYVPLAAGKIAGAVGIVIGYKTQDIQVVSSYYFEQCKSTYDNGYNGERYAGGDWSTTTPGKDNGFTVSTEDDLTDGTVLTALNEWVEANKETYPTLKSWAAGEDDFPILILSETSAPGANSLNVVESNY